MRCPSAVVLKFRTVRSVILILAGVVPAIVSHAQFAHFAGVESVVVSSGLSNPGQVSVDSAGNVFVLDTGNSRVLKETPGASGYQQSVVTSTAMNSPTGLAVDANGNVFIVDSGNNRILQEAPSAGGYTEAVMAITGLNAPTGIAVDATGDLYISDTGNNRVVEEILSGTNYSQTTVVTGIAAGSIAVDKFGYLYVQLVNSGQVERLIVSGSTYLPLSLTGSLSATTSVTVDPADVVYILDGGNAHILRELSSGSASYIQKNVITNAGAQWAGLAVDGNRNLYFCDSVNGRVLKLDLKGADFGTIPVGTTSSAISLIFGFDAGGTFASTAALTQGIAGLDYADAGTGTCTTNGAAHTYESGDTCTLDVVFTPKGPGGRYGAAILKDGSGSAMATGYVQGDGSSPQVHFPPVLSELSLPGLTSPTRITADAAGNLYIVNAVAAFDSGNAVYKETLIGGGYVQSTVATNLAYPLNVKVDGAGNVYVLDEGVYDIYKYSPNPSGGYTKSTFDTAYSNANALGIDGFGNVYFASGNNIYTSGLVIDTAADGYYGQRQLDVNAYAVDIGVDYKGDIYLSTFSPNENILRETPSSSGNYVQSTVSSSLSATWLAVDGVGNVYVACAGSNCELTPEGNSYAQTSLPTFGPAYGIAVDGTPNVYLADNLQKTVWKIDFSKPPALHYAATSVGHTSTDSPQILTIQNSGNAPLSFPIPGAGANPGLPSGFAFDGTSTCPETGSGATTPGTLSAGASCNLSIDFSPQLASDTSGWMVLTDDALNAPAPAYATQSVALAVLGSPLTPTLNWSTPANIVYGTALGGQQLNATANVAGTFSYSPSLGTVLGVGPQTLTATFTPNDTVAFTSKSTTVTLVVTQATPAITWPNPAAITYGTALSSTQLNASCLVAGTLSYSPAAGTILHAGSQTLTVTFTPTDSVDYTQATGSVTLTVNQATPAITWASPAAVTYGTALSAAQLDASSPVAGTFSYSPASGTVLNAGLQTLNTTFTPTDTTDYTTANTFVTLTVNPATPTITWAAPAAITYGTALSAAQLNATASVPGTFAYSPAVGAVLPVGSQTLKVTFTPTDVTDYATATASATVTVNQATPTITWASPAAITYGTTLSATQLNATASVPGTFVYSPAAGAVLPVGSQTLKATFTPTDTTDYTSATQSVTLIVNSAAPTITWATPAPITYGTALSATQLNATAGVPGTFTYSPAAGTVLGAGSQTLTATFTPTDTNDYGTATDSVTITVNQATPSIALSSSANPADVSQAITFTAAVSFAAGAPTGSVTFYNGTTQLGSGTLSGGTATYTTSALTSGSYTITAVYGGDANFTSVTSSPLTQNVASFGVSTPSGGNSSSTISPGGTATFGLSVTPPGNSAVTFSVTGQPSGATAAFSPSTVAAGAPATAVTLSITVPSQSAAVVPDRPGARSPMPLAVGLFVLPLLGLRRLRKGHRALLVLLLCFAGAVGMAALNGCGGGGSSSGGGGGGQQPRTYNLTVTATAGSLTQNTNLTLTVQ